MPLGVWIRFSSSTQCKIFRIELKDKIHEGLHRGVYHCQEDRVCAYKWFIFALSLQKRMSKIANQYMTSMQTRAWEVLHGTHAPTYTSMKRKKIPFPQPCALRFWIFIDDINRRVKGSKVDSWLAKSSKHLVGKGWYKPNMGGGFPIGGRWVPTSIVGGTISASIINAKPPILGSHFWVPPNMETSLTTQFSNYIENPATPLPEHTNKRESTLRIGHGLWPSHTLGMTTLCPLLTFRNEIAWTLQRCLNVDEEEGLA